MLLSVGWRLYRREQQKLIPCTISWRYHARESLGKVRILPKMADQLRWTLVGLTANFVLDIYSRIAHQSIICFTIHLQARHSVTLIQYLHTLGVVLHVKILEIDF